MVDFARHLDVARRYRPCMPSTMVALEVLDSAPDSDRLVNAHAKWCLA